MPKRRSERLRQQAVFERSQAVVDVDGGPGPSGLQAFEQLIEPAGPSGIQRVRSRSNENGWFFEYQIIFLKNRYKRVLSLKGSIRQGLIKTVGSVLNLAPSKLK